MKLKYIMIITKKLYSWIKNFKKDNLIKLKFDSGIRRVTKAPFKSRIDKNTLYYCIKVDNEKTIGICYLLKKDKRIRYKIFYDSFEF